MKQLIEALLNAQAEFTTVVKDKENPFFHSKYADLATIVEMAQPILTKNKLAIVQFPSYELGGEGFVETLVTRLVHESGEYIESKMLLLLVKKDPQAQGSAITYARRYAYSSILGIVTDDDDDGNLASTPVKTVAKRPTRKPPETKPPESKEPGSSEIKLISPAQTKLLHSLISRCGFDKDTAHGYATAIIEREFTSSKELTSQEAAKVIQSMINDLEVVK